MAYHNTFNCLTDFTSDDTSLFTSDCFRSSNSPKPVQSKPAPRTLPLKKCCEVEGQDGNRLIECGFRRKFGMSEDGDVEKEANGGNPRRVVDGGLKRSFSNNANSILLFGPGREFVDQESEDFINMLSPKFYNRRGLSGRGLAKKKTGRKKEGAGKSYWGRIFLTEDFDFMDMGDKGLYAAVDCVPKKQVIRRLTKEDESETMTLDQYLMVEEERKQALQATLKEIAAKHQEEEAFINEYVMVEVETEVDDFLVV